MLKRHVDELNEPGIRPGDSHRFIHVEQQCFSLSGICAHACMCMYVCACVYICYIYIVYVYIYTATNMFYVCSI